MEVEMEVEAGFEDDEVETRAGWDRIRGSVE
jgi:hypothetical protein